MPEGLRTSVQQVVKVVDQLRINFKNLNSKIEKSGLQILHKLLLTEYSYKHYLTPETAPDQPVCVGKHTLSDDIEALPAQIESQIISALSPFASALRKIRDSNGASILAESKLATRQSEAEVERAMMLQRIKDYEQALQSSRAAQADFVSAKAIAMLAQENNQIAADAVQQLRHEMGAKIRALDQRLFEAASERDRLRQENDALRVGLQDLANGPQVAASWKSYYEGQQEASRRHTLEVENIVREVRRAHNDEIERTERPNRTYDALNVQIKHVDVLYKSAREALSDVREENLLRKRILNEQFSKVATDLAECSRKIKRDLNDSNGTLREQGTYIWQLLDKLNTVQDGLRIQLRTHSCECERAYSAWTEDAVFASKDLRAASLEFDTQYKKLLAKQNELNQERDLDRKYDAVAREAVLSDRLANFFDRTAHAATSIEIAQERLREIIEDLETCTTNLHATNKALIAGQSASQKQVEATQPRHPDIRGELTVICDQESLLGEMDDLDLLKCLGES